MSIHPRQPYAGELVFTAFSGSHQDAIKKGMDAMREQTDPDAPWRVPYLPIDPKDIGRTYRAIVRINSQSGKGGAAYVLSREFGYELPKQMHPGLGRLVNEKADVLGRELSAKEVYDIFAAEYMNRTEPLTVQKYSINSGNDLLSCEAEVTYNGNKARISGEGNGPIDAFVHAMKKEGWDDFTLMDFHEHSVGSGSGTEAVAYVRIDADDNTMFWGAGKDTDINKAGLKALVSAYNRKQS
jgi:2-isopropylmalate synthase